MSQFIKFGDQIIDYLNSDWKDLWNDISAKF